MTRDVMKRKYSDAAKEGVQIRTQLRQECIPT